MIFGDTPQTWWARMALLGDLSKQVDASPRAWYDMLEMYYLNNGLYDAIKQAYYDSAIWTEAMKGLRNPANRVVEFHVAKLWSGELTVVTKNERIVEPIEQVLKWSNWDVRKRVGARWFANLGDWFIKVATRSDATGRVNQVYYQQIKPQYVTALEEDDRGYLTMIRVDIPVTRRVDGKPTSFTHTEYWDKSAQLYQRWEHSLGNDAALERLGAPIEQRSFGEFGIDFVPFAHAKFRDIGDLRGLCAYGHALDKIDEANRQATRLHQMLFRYNKAIWALEANAQDATGRPLPPPRVGTGGEDNNDGATLEVGDDALISLPGTSRLSGLVPQIDYEAALKILQDQMRELEFDLPEMAYYSIKEAGGQLSGRAVRLMLSDAVDRVLEARSNAESTLAQANEMALTIGSNAGLWSVGSYEAGDFSHSFQARPVIETSEFEAAETMRAETQAGVPVVTSARRAGWTPAEIEQMREDRREERSEDRAALGQAMLDAQRNFDQNGAAE